MSVDVGFRSERGPLLVALIVATALGAINGPILATAVPTIISELGGFTSFPWLFTIFLLTQAATIPVFGRLSDAVGRKPIMMVGILLTLVGALLCSLATSIEALIVFRAIQGVGAGAVHPMAITIAGDIYTLRERAKVQSYIATVWAIASAAGSVVGGIFAQAGFWRGAFLINIPMCLLAGWLILRHFRDFTGGRRRQRFDVWGAVLLVSSVSLLLLAILEGGRSWEWLSVTSIVLVGLGAAFGAAFVLVELRVSEPLLPMGILRRRTMVTTTAVSAGIGAILLGLTSYVPVYLEKVLHLQPVWSGVVLGAFIVGWPVGAALSGRAYLRFGFRATCILGAAVSILGSAALTAFATLPSVALVVTTCTVIGLGIGLMGPASMVAAQSSAIWGERGVVSALYMFARSIGSAFGVAVFGAMVTLRISSDDIDVVPLEDVTGALVLVFTGVLVVSVASLIASLAMERRGTASQARGEDLPPVVLS